MKRKVLVGTRGSLLALKQTEQVVARLRALHPGLEIEVRVIRTGGDRAPETPFSRMDARGIFVKELEAALERSEIDLAVHSLKDVPTRIPPVLVLAAFPERDSPWDALVSPSGHGLDELPPGARIGTGSPRRGAQIRARRPDLAIEEIRGNLDTRLKKADRGDYEAVIVAACGLERMGWENRITQLLPAEVCLPAVGQGALAVEARASDAEILRLLEPLDHPATRQAVLAERSFLEALGGGCQVPIAALATLQDSRLTLDGLVARPDGDRLWRSRVSGKPGEPLGQKLARELLEMGAREVVTEVSP